MKSRAWVGIVVIGILGITLLGFLTKFAIESSTDLQHIIRFKTAFAQDFTDDGVREVSLRKRRGGGGYSLVLTGSREDLRGASAGLDRRVATYFLENFPDDAARILDVSYVAEGAFGCRDDSLCRSQEIALGPLRRDIAMQEIRARLAEELLRGSGCRFVSETRENRVLTVEIEGPAAPFGGQADPRSLALEIEPLIRKHLRVHPYVRLRLRVLVKRPGTLPAAHPAAGATDPRPTPPAKDFVEVQFDARGRTIGR